MRGPHGFPQPWLGLVEAEADVRAVDEDPLDGAQDRGRAGGRDHASALDTATTSKGLGPSTMTITTGPHAHLPGGAGPEHGAAHAAPPAYAGPARRTPAPRPQPGATTRARLA
ncbi:hypothetical protein SSAG_02549 [Streptomyces sp. Mg1]|nr:hypothetical protein SSAG_02549 [Streptomyces sp. Mg1]